MKMKGYKSSVSRLMRFFEKSRNKWRAHAAEKQEKIRALETLLREEQHRSLPTEATRRTATVADHVYSLLAERQEPTHYTVIYEELRKRGVDVPGKVPLSNLLAHLSRDDRFRRGNTRGVYSLTEWGDGLGEAKAEGGDASAVDFDPFAEDRAGEAKPEGGDLSSIDLHPFADEENGGNTTNETTEAEDFDPFAD